MLAPSERSAGVSLLAGHTVLALDTETTGMSPVEGHRLVEVARVAIVDGVLGEEWSSLVDPGRAIPADAARVHGISDAMVAGAPRAPEVGRLLRAACADLPLVFHNAPALLNPIIDTLGLSRGLFGPGSKSLGALAAKLSLPAETAHRALGDTRTTARLFVELAGRWEQEKGVHSLLELAAVSQDLMRATARR